MRNGQSGFIDATASNVQAVCCQDGEPNFDVGSILPQREWFAVMAREFWQLKADASISFFTGYSDRTCRSWAPVDREPSEPPARALALLLRSPEGPRVLCWIMRNNPPEWWRQLQDSINGLSILRE